MQWGRRKKPFPETGLSRRNQRVVIYSKSIASVVVGKTYEIGQNVLPMTINVRAVVGTIICCEGQKRQEAKLDVSCASEFVTCNLLPLKVFLSIIGTSATLKMYSGSTMSPLGKSTLRCTKGEMTKDVDIFIVDDDVRPVLGAKRCLELNFIKVMVNDTLQTKHKVK